MTENQIYGDSSTWTALSSFENDLKARNFTKMKLEIAEGVGRGYPVWDVVSKILKHVGIGENHKDAELITFFTDSINEFFELLSFKEWILIFLAELQDSSTSYSLRFSLPFIKRSISAIGFDNCKEIASILLLNQNKVEEIIDSVDTDAALNTGLDDLFNLLRDIGEFLLSIFSIESSSELKCRYLHQVLYYFAKPLYLLDVSETTFPVFSYYLSTLQLCCNGVYTDYLNYARKTYMSIDNAHIDSPSDESLASAFILVQRVCRNNSCYWPNILDANFELSLLITLSVVKCSSFEKSIRGGIPISLVDKRGFLLTLDFIMELLSNRKCILSNEWWKKSPTYLLICLESFSKLPLSSLEMPPETRKAISCIECLLSAATITARCHLFTGIIQRSTSEYHCGFRAHYITLFKNFLHEALLLTLDATSSKCFDCKRGLEGESFCLPYNKVYLQSVCETIFIYPLPECKESVLDQFSWLMAALNMVLYIKLRCSSNILTPVLATSLLQAVIRRDHNGISRLKSRFMDPLVSDVCELSKKYERAEREHISTKNPVLAPGAPSLEECQRVLLRLRLLKDLLNRLENLSAE